MLEQGLYCHLGVVDEHRHFLFAVAFCHEGYVDAVVCVGSRLQCCVWGSVVESDAAY